MAVGGYWPYAPRSSPDITHLCSWSARATNSARSLCNSRQATGAKGKMAKASGDLQSIFAPLDQDFGVSGGIPGIVKNLVTFLGNMALGGAISQSPSLQAAAMSMTSKQPQNAGGTGYGPSSDGASMMGSFVGMSRGYAGDAALLANVPAGRYTQTQGADLTKGLADCSSSVEDLVNIMDGRPTAGRSLATGNASTWLPQHGFQQGVGGPGDFRVGYNSGHMQATLPGGTPFNWGSDASAANRGIGGTGAADPAFTDHWYRPAGTGATSDPYAGTGPASIGPAPLGGGVGAPPAPMGAGMPGPSGLPAIPSGAGGQGYMRLGGPAQSTSPQSFAPAATGGGGKGGIGLNESTLALAGSAADMFAPGASKGLQLANRAIQFGGQAAAIGVQGLMETLLPHNSELGDPGKSWFGKIAGGLAGARPASPNQAGKSAPPQQGPPAGGKEEGPGQTGPMVNIENMHTGGSDGQGVGQDIARQQYASYSVGGPR